MNKQLFFPQLPPKYADKFYISESINISASKTFIVCSKESNTPEYVLKTVGEYIFNKNIYKKIKSVKCENLQNDYEYILYQHNYYIFSPYQQNLVSILTTCGLSLSNILKLAADIGNALEKLNNSSICHLDCTPDNIYCTSDNTYCLGDFSSSMFYQKNNTQTLYMTPGFIPPEIKNEQKVSNQSDQYILATTLYTLLNNGYKPDDRNSSCFDREIPVCLQNIIRKAMSDNPSERYKSLAEFTKNICEISSSPEVLSSTYRIQISEKEHPLSVLATKPLPKTFSPVPKIDHDKKAAKKPANKTPAPKPPVSKPSKKKSSNIPLIILVLITGVLCAAAFYKFVYIPKQEKEKKTEELMEFMPSESFIASMENLENNIASTTSESSENQQLCSESPAISESLEEQTSEISEPENTIEENDDELKELDFDNNNLKKIPYPNLSDMECNKISCIYANNNQLEDLESLTDFPSLTELYLSDNHISDISDIYDCTHLKTLVISYNDITDISPLGSLLELENLDISGNKNLSDVLSLAYIPNLKLLNITDTNITVDEVSYIKSYIPDCTIIY